MPKVILNRNLCVTDWQSDGAEAKMDAKETLHHLMDTIEKDYNNPSPTSAIVLFALGAAFGNALSSK